MIHSKNVELSCLNPTLLCSPAQIRHTLFRLECSIAILFVSTPTFSCHKVSEQYTLPTRKCQEKSARISHLKNKSTISTE